MKSCLNRLTALALTCILLVGSLPAAAAAPARFTDVPASHWAAPSISRAVDLGLFQGETHRTFGLGHKMTRAAFAAVLCRFFGWELITPDKSTFTDAQDPSRWYWSALETAVAHGAITRQTDTFRPREALTREEMAVMLVRALGYGSMAGLAQSLPSPFRDVDSSAGYLSMAYELGIMKGTSATTFSPNWTASREQVAVTLMRLYDLRRAPAPCRAAIADRSGDFTGLDAVAISAGKLVFNGQVRLSSPLSADQAQSLRGDARAQGAQALLRVTGTGDALRGDPEATAETLAQAVIQDGYDGLFLDLPQLTAASRDALTQLVQSTDRALGDRAFWVTAEAPAGAGLRWDGYDYAALGRSADRLILHVAPLTPEPGPFPIAPLEPLEDVYCALAQVQVPPEKLGLLLTTTGTAWGQSIQGQSLTAEEIADLLKSPQVTPYYSDRYACAYLTGAKTQISVWYLDQTSVAQRVQLARLFGLETLCLSRADSVSPGVRAGLA